MSTPSKRIVRVKNFAIDVSDAMLKATYGRRYAARGDNALRRLVFGSDDVTQPRVVNERVALSLSSPFSCHDNSRKRPIGEHHSFAGLCFEHGRVDLLREVALAQHPDVVDGLLVKSTTSWLSYLCQYKGFDHVRRGLALVTIATDVIGPHTASFIELALELGANEDAIAGTVAAGGRRAAAILETQMRVRMRQAEQASPPDAPTAPPRRRPVGV